MTIDSRCKEQQNVADRMFMDFKYTAQVLRISFEPLRL